MGAGGDAVKAAPLLSIDVVGLESTLCVYQLVQGVARMFTQTSWSVSVCLICLSFALDGSSVEQFVFFCACELIPHRATAALSGTTSQGKMYIPCPSVCIKRE